MKSPFPGMDPYLEKQWRDVHHRLITYACDQLQSQLPEELRSRVEERVFIEKEEGLPRVYYPDTYVVEKPMVREAGAKEGGVALAEPIILRFPHETIGQGYIEIIDASSGARVVTVIEFLSPSNKVPGPGRDSYLREQEDVLAARISLVEVDLVRQGGWTLSVNAGYVPVDERATCAVCVRRGWSLLEAELYPIPLQERLPVIRVPLRQTDEDVTLDLQALIDQCYRNGRYDDLDYRAAPEPPLDGEDARWADELLQRTRES